MKFSLLLFTLFLYTSVSATDYYISASGNDANTGLSISTSWKTIAKVNSSNFLPDDRILFHCGDIWRETLTVPSSGSTGRPITIGAYGTGSLPVINGANVISVFTSDTGTQGPELSPNVGFDANIIPWSSNSFSYQVSAIGGRTNVGRLLAGSPSNVATWITGRGLTSIPTTVTFDIYIPSTNVKANNLRAREIGGANRFIGDSNPSLNTWTTITIKWTPLYDTFYLYMANGTNVMDVAVGDVIYLDNISIKADEGGIAVANVYNATLSSHTDQVFRDGVRAVEGTSKAALNDHEWFCDGVNLSYRDDSGSPQGAAYTIEASVRNANIQIAKDWVGKNYVTISGLKLTKSNFNALDWPASSTNTVVTGCDINYAYMNGVSSLAGVGATNVQVSLNNISWNGACGVNVIGLSHDWEISNNNVFRNCQYADGVGEHNWNAGIHTWCEDGTVIRLNIIHNIISENGKLPNDTWIAGIRGCGIHMDSPTATNHANGNFIGYNRIYDNNYMGIHLERTTYQTVAYNLVYNNVDSYGIILSQWDGAVDKQVSYNKIYNNTCYGNLTGIIVLGTGSMSANVCIGNTVKNNICFGNTWPYQFVAGFGGQNDGRMGYGNEYLYNCFGPEKNGVIQWDDVAKTYAGFDTSYGSFTHSVQMDPLFVDATNGDFHLQSTSPCINKGVNVELTNDFDGNTINSQPDIGAYEFYLLPIPIYKSSAIENATPSLLEMTYSLNLANIVPATSAFTVLVNSVARTVSTVAIAGTKVQLSLASTIAFGDVVTVAYAKPVVSPLQTNSAGQAASITAKAVTNSINPPVPVFVSSAVGNATPSILEMTYSLNLANIVPATSAFTVLVNSVARTVSAVAISGTKVQLTLASAILFGDVVTVAYTKPAVSPLQTNSAGQAASITAQAVINSINPPVPVYVSSTVWNATPSVLEMTYDLSLANIVPATSAFSVLVNSVVRTVSTVAISGTKVQLTLASSILFGDVVTVAYTKPVTSPLQTTSAGQAASIIAQAVTNSINPPVPVYVSSTVGNATPSLLEMTYSLNMANIVPATSAFSVLVNSVARSVSAVAISGTKVQLTLANAIAFGDVVTVAYTKPATSPLQTSSAGQAASITAKALTNSINPPVPVYVSSAVGNATPSLIEMTYSLSLANIVPATSAFTVLVNSVARTVSAVTITGAKVQLTLANAILFGDVVTVAYIKPATSPLQTASAGQAVSITAKAVTNSINPPVPVYVSSAVGNATPSLLEMTYSLSLANIVPATSAFSVLVNSVARTVSAAAITGTKVQLTLASAIAFGDVVTVAYTKPATSPLQTISAGQAASISAQAVTNSINPPVPVYVSSGVGNATPSVLEMTYSLSLANIVPVPSAFTVLVNSVARTVSAVAISGTKVQLTLASAILFGDIVTVAYTKPTTSPLQTSSAGQAASITAKTVTNSINPPVPVYISSTVGNATPSLIEITYSLSLANIIPATSAFSVLVNSVARTVNSIAISGTKVQLTLASAILFGDVVTVAYTKPVTSPLQTTSAGQAASITAKAVTNSINPPVPVYFSSTVGNATPSLLEMNYSLSLANIVPATSAFTVLVNSVARTVSAVAISGTKVQLTLASAILFGDVVTAAYTKPAVSPLQTTSAGQVASITAQAVTNNINPPIPVYVSSAVGNATPSLIEMTYSLNLANILPATSAFTVLVNSVARSVSAVVISGTKVQLTLASAILFGDVVTVAYTKPAVSPLQTTSAGQAVSITAKAVTNSINPPVPVYVSSAVGNATPSLIEMTYSLNLANIIPATSAFTVLVNSVARTVSAVAITGTKVQLTLASAIIFGDVVKVAYTKPAVSPLQTTSAGQAASITAQAVTNSINPPVPVFVSSTVGNATPSLLEMTYSLSLANIVPATSAFSVLVNSVARTVGAVTITGAKVQLTLASAILFGDVVTVAYTKPATSPLQTTSAGQAVSITAKVVTNSINPPVPVYVSSTVGNATPSLLEMTYDLSLANIVPATSALTVQVNSVARTVSSVVLSGTKVQLTLASAILFGDVVTVAYTKPAVSPLQTTSDGQAISISAQVVTNSTNPTGINGSHFVPVWQGENGTNHMNLIVVSATLENLPLSADDEIAVFSGSKCVGSMMLTESINPAFNSTFLVIPASQDDGSNNGFINNDSIIFKIWDHTNMREMETNVVKYKSEMSTWLTSGKYSAGATSVVEIATFTENIQNIALLQGYNLISTYISPNDPNVSTVLKQLCDQGELIKVQDEAGNSFENWGSLGGWINKLGSFESTEGYKIKVANNCTLRVTGRPIVLPLDIPLKSGWNIISFPRTDLVDAMDIIQSLIDQNKLVKVQDEAGNSIENWGAFGGWINAIGNFTPGKAYKVKSNADAVITIHENYLKSAAIPATAAKAEYFSTKIEGNGTDHMNINIVGLREAGLSIGDELAAFDGDVCVGSLKITKNQMMNGTAGLVASATTDAQKPNGFKEGNIIRIAGWNKLTNKEFQVQTELLSGQLNYQKEASVLVRLGALTPDAKSSNDLIKTEVYPNPCKGKFTVRFSAIPEAGSRIEILDISGRNILSRDVFETSEEFNLDQQQPGIYIVKTIIGATQRNHKLIIY